MPHGQSSAMDVKSTKAADDVTCWNHIRAKLMVWLEGWYKWVKHTSFMMIIIPSLFLTLGVLAIIWNPNLSPESKHHFSWSNQGQERKHSQESRSCDVYTGRWHHCNFCLHGFPGWSSISEFMLKYPSFPPNRKLIEELASGSIVIVKGTVIFTIHSHRVSYRTYNISKLDEMLFQQDHTIFPGQPFFPTRPKPSTQSMRGLLCSASGRFRTWWTRHRKPIWVAKRWRREENGAGEGRLEASWIWLGIGVLFVGFGGNPIFFLTDQTFMRLGFFRVSLSEEDIQIQPARRRPCQVSKRKMYGV